MLRAGDFGRRGYPSTGVRPSPGAVSGAFQPLPVAAGNEAWTWREAAEKWGWPGGMVVGLGLRVQASVSSSQVSALGQGSAVRDRRGGFRGLSFFRFIKRSASGSGKGRDFQPIHPPESPRRDPWISAKSRPRDLFVDDSARFVDKSWSPALAALANRMRSECCPSGAPCHPFPPVFSHHEPRLESPSIRPRPAGRVGGPSTQARVQQPARPPPRERRLISLSSQTTQPANSVR